MKIEQKTIRLPEKTENFTKNYNFFTLLLAKSQVMGYIIATFKMCLHRLEA